VGLIVKPCQLTRIPASPGCCKSLGKAIYIQRDKAEITCVSVYNPGVVDKVPYQSSRGFLDELSVWAMESDKVERLEVSVGFRIVGAVGDHAARLGVLFAETIVHAVKS
jgi:hypothetical protein